jgi:hypothetical protein
MNTVAVTNTFSHFILKDLNYKKICKENGVYKKERSIPKGMCHFFTFPIQTTRVILGRHISANTRRLKQHTGMALANFKSEKIYFGDKIKRLESIKRCLSTHQQSSSLCLIRKTPRPTTITFSGSSA